MRCCSRLFGFGCLALILFGLLWLATGARSQTSPVTGGKQGELSSIRFTIVDKDSHSVDTLQLADVRLRENDQSRETIALRKLDEQTLAVAILIDVSRSQEGTLTKEKLAADAFVQAIMRPGKDQVGVVTFTGTATVEQDLTKNLGLARRGVARAEMVSPYVDSSVAAGKTAVWDSIWATCDELFPTTATETRNAIILLSDGEDTYSRTKMSEAAERALKANVAVYSIGIGDEQTFKINRNDLRKLAERTGGHAFFPKTSQELVAAFTEIQQDLRHQYEITYRSAGKSGSSQNVRLEIINPSLRARNLQISYQRITSGAAH